MRGTRGDTTSEQPVERFKPTGGRITGYVGLLLVAVGVGYVLWRVHTVTGLRVGLGLLAFGTLIWITQLRPRAAAYTETLHLTNMLRDTIVPLRLIDEVSVRQMLCVWVGYERYACIGIGRSVRALTGHKRPTSRVLGFGKMNDMAEEADLPSLEQTAMPYQNFVEIRIDDLVKYAKKNPVTDPDAQVRQVWAVPELVVLVVTTTGFVVSLFL